MISLRVVVGWAVVGVALISAAAEPQLSAPQVFQYDVATTARLGREIYRQDRLAWQATDVLTAAVPKEKLAAGKPAGWVVDTSAQAAVVRFLREKPRAGASSAEEAEIEASYDVVFHKGKTPELVVPDEPKLTPDQLARARATQVALRALRESKRAWCGGNPNFVVLKEPASDDLLVYVLRPKTRDREIPVGGHYRIVVAPGGTIVKRIDALFASCLTLSREPDAKEAAPVALFMSHIVSTHPLETHVFLSLQEKLPFIVAAAGGQWQVSEGRISRVNLDAKAGAPSAGAAK